MNPTREDAMRTRHLTLLAALLTLAAAGAARGERIKDIADVEGVRGNPIWGYGLVVGLNSTGDNSEASKRALANILRRTGLRLTPDDISSKNIASVMVTAQLPPFARPGSRIDVTVSAIGSAESLQGGTLLMTPLLGADGEVYAVAQGQLTVGGFSVSGKASSISKNHPTVGRISGGATVEKAELADIVRKGAIHLQLRYPDFTTAERVAAAINKEYEKAATAVDAGSVRVNLPATLARGKLAAFIDEIGALEVEVDQQAVVIINERTGTIVVGEHVRISMVAISHGNLSIVTREQEQVSQPAPFSRVGSTEKVQRTDIKAVEQGGALHVVPEQVTVAELAAALNAMGMTPRDLMSIFEALREAGALQARLKIM
jgi:flagellar P-ring protein precursor FlgI